MHFPRTNVFLGCLFLFVLPVIPCVGQSPNGNINGLVLDPTSQLIVGAEVIAVNDVTGVQYITKTNNVGVYVLPNLPPGPYRIQVSKVGFKTIIKPDIVLNVQDALSINFTLPIGALLETVTVTGGAPLVESESAAVSTVVDRQFAENLPMNGRTFQTLIELAPGVVTVPTNTQDAGQFSVNGQRASSNYWMVDGVSANIGMSATPNPGNGLGGGVGSFSASGGTNSLVSVDAMQEFRIQTSTYAPEFGRTPGAQISIVTRSGTNQFHGTAFDYLRNDLLNANDWFADYSRLAKPVERQNDFGGTFSGPLLKSRAFFFFSYEGLRLRLPEVALYTVPDLAARQNAVPSMQPYLNAFPLDPNQPDLGNGIAQYNASYANAASLDAYSIRLDQKIGANWSVFGRYNYSPSDIIDRGASGTPLSVVTPTRIATQTLTVGTTGMLSSTVTDDLRFNYSRTNSASSNYVDAFGGATPLTSLPFPGAFTIRNSFLSLALFSLKGDPLLDVGRIQRNLQRQYNLVDGLSVQKGPHGLKFGVDFRRLSPVYDPPVYEQLPAFFDIPTAETGIAPFNTIVANIGSTFLFRNLGLYAQDTWRVSKHFTLTYGLRWDIDFAPSSLSGPNLAAITGYNMNDLSQVALAPPGTTPFGTRYNGFAPRVGVAYELSDSAKWQTVLRGGMGLFYDLVSSAAGTLLSVPGYPFSASSTSTGTPFPLDPSEAAPPAIDPASLATCCSALAAFNPHLELPYSLQWNVALEQELGVQQSVSASYIGSLGHRLLQSEYVFSPNPNLYAVQVLGNTASSNYNAFQLRFQRRLSGGLQALASYTWAHSIDDGSAASNFVGSNEFVATLGSRANRGPSDFDIRNSFSAGITYEIRAPKGNAVKKAVLGGWSAQNFVIASSPPPVDIFYSASANGALLKSQTNVRPDLVTGQPLYLFGSQCVQVLGPPCAGGKGLNPAAFTSPPVDPTSGNPIRQGDLGRNAVRGFGVVQWDFAMHRDFPIGDRVKLQFRAELFNILNHPNFGPPVGDLGSPQTLNPQFGQSQLMLGQSLSGAQYAGNVGSGALSPLYQIGGPRTVQLALKLSF
jgi:hypothetical protein